MTNSAHEHRRAAPPADSPGGDRIGVTLARDAFQMEQEGIRYASPQAGEREQIARILSKVSKAALNFGMDVGPNPSVVIEEAVDVIIALFLQAGEREQIARLIDPDGWARRENPWAYGDDPIEQRDWMVADSLRKADAIIAAARLALPPQAAPGVERPTDAITNLTECQRQLDMDGCHVGVSRQALDEVLAYVAVYSQPFQQGAEALHLAKNFAGMLRAHEANIDEELEPDDDSVRRGWEADLAALSAPRS